MRKFFQSSGTSAPTQSSSAHPAHHNHDKHEPDHVLVKHGKEYLRVNFSAHGDIVTGRATVGDVRATTARFLGKHKSEIVLLCGGKKLTADKDTLASHNVSSGTRMLCIVSEHKENGTHSAHSHHHHEQRAEQQKPKLPPAGPIERIDAVLAAVEKELVPKIEQFEMNTPTMEPERTDTHRMLSELLLQKLFLLDEVDTHEKPEARKHRKETVNKLHAFQARVDKAIAPPE
ncbi:uncharacterized protein V1518DRAFT_423232 [Limtongia smithiae]|uniref:uncharacterized protein n=1 Tax=Limtongia smithiae TaxID=1125753 RepID=UPI0034CF41BE